MKKLLFIFAISLFTLVSCTPDKTIDEELQEQGIEKEEIKEEDI